MYLASIGELILIFALIYLIVLLHKQHSDNKLYTILAQLACFFVVVTASIGAFRFAGFEQVIYIHDVTSYWSKHAAMMVYATCVALMLKSNISNSVYFTLGVIGLSPILGTPAFLTDVALFLTLASLALQKTIRTKVLQALFALLLVPATAVMSNMADLQMGLFHLFLAGHFYFIAQIFKTRSSQ